MRSLVPLFCVSYLCFWAGCGLREPRSRRQIAKSQRQEFRRKPVLRSLATHEDLISQGLSLSQLLLAFAPEGVVTNPGLSHRISAAHLRQHPFSPRVAPCRIAMQMPRKERERERGRVATMAAGSVSYAAEPRTVDPDSSFGILSEQTSDIKCPFWRTRAYDALDSALTVANFVAARHKSFLDRPWLPGSKASLFEPLSLPVRQMGTKSRGLPIEAVMEVVRDDIELRQYYVTGRLSPDIYSNRCFFDGPDPDMPVKSLGRYSDALKGLFDPKLSTISLLGMEKTCERSFVAHWRLSGALKLPWRPQIKPYLGATRYECDEDGLIVSHNEVWSISAFEAFGSTVWPSLGGPFAPEAGVLQRNETLWRWLQPPPPRILRADSGAGQPEDVEAVGSSRD